MRIDLVLKYLCLVKSRSIAKSLCDQGRVLVDGEAVKSSSRVQEGDRVTIQFDRDSVTVSIETVPEKQLSKARALTYYRRVGTPNSERRAGHTDPLDDL
jgi:ribosomal 50S subunit-recycling heat shock protein